MRSVPGAFICATLRPLRNTLVLVLWIGWRRRHGHRHPWLREGVVLFTRGVLGAKCGDVGRLVAWVAFLVGEFSCVFLCLGRASHVSLLRQPCSRLLRSYHVFYHLKLSIF